MLVNILVPFVSLQYNLDDVILQPMTAKLGVPVRL